MNQRWTTALLLLAAACSGPMDPDFSSDAEGLTRSVPDKYATIQAAIDAASAGDTVQIAAGTYAERLTIAKNLKLVGAGDRLTVLDAGGGVGIFVGEGLQVHLRGLTVRNGSYGVQATGNPQTGAVRILEAGFEDLERGVWASGRTTIVQRSRFERNQTALLLGDEARAYVSNNLFLRGTWGVRLVSTVAWFWVHNNVFAWNTEHVAMLDGGQVWSSRHDIGYNDFWAPANAGGTAANNGFYYGSCNFTDSCVFPNSLTVDPGFVSLTSSWTSAGELVVNHGSAPRAVTLLDGRVLVAGGMADDFTLGQGMALREAEIYDPKLASSRWSLTGSMIAARDYFALALLPDGRVLASGGQMYPVNPLDEVWSVPLASAEIWDPATGAWTATAALPAPRAGHNATTLADGRVLVTGGGSAGADLYQPASGQWSSLWYTGPADRAARLAQSGRVLLVARSGAAQLFDPQNDTFLSAGSVPQALSWSFSLTALADGRAVVVDGPTRAVWVYQEAGNVWSQAASLPVALDNHAAVEVGSRLLVTGGHGPVGVTTESFFGNTDPTHALTWADAGGSPSNHWSPTAVKAGAAALVLSEGTSSSGAPTLRNPSDLWDPAIQGQADYHLRADSLLANAGNPYVLDQDRGRSDVGMYGSRVPQVRSASVSPSKATVTTKVKFSCYFADLVSPQRVEVILGSGLGTQAATTTDTWPANDATYVAYLSNPPLGKHSYRCHGVTAEGLDVYYPALGSYRYFTVDPDLATVQLTSPVAGTVVASTQTSLTVEIKTTASTYGYTVKVYYSRDGGATFSYKSAARAVKSPDGDVYRTTLSRGTNFGPGTLHLYAYGRDGNGPTLYDKNGGAYYPLTIQ